MGYCIRDIKTGKYYSKSHEPNNISSLWTSDKGDAQILMGAIYDYLKLFRGRGWKVTFEKVS